MVKKTAKQIYNLLLNKTNIIGRRGVIKFNLADVSMNVKTKDVIGNIIQSWLGEWMKSEKIDFEEPPNSQEFPDFFLNPDNKKEGLLEVKTFDVERGANFDIANFQAYCRSLLKNSYRLDADYLILGYSMNEEGFVKIEKIRLKKIWEISGESQAYPVKVQQKQGMIYNLRPIVWESQSKTAYKCFQTKQEFVKAIEKTLLKYSNTKDVSANWLREVSENYGQHTGKKLI